MADLFRIAMSSVSSSEADRTKLKDQITRLVGYPCMISCHSNHGSVDIYVMSMKKRIVTDWFELQPSGAIGVIYDNYDDFNKAAMDRLDDVCERYNALNGYEFFSDSEEEEESEEEESEEVGAAAAPAVQAGAGGPAAAAPAAQETEDQKEKVD